jgi:signal peptidase
MHRLGTRGDDSRMFRAMTGFVLFMAAIISVATAVAVGALGIGFAPVLTDSMSPGLDAGSVAITRRKATQELVVGDVVVLPLPDGDGQRYLHRIVEVRPAGDRIHVRTKGDQNPLVDPWTLHVASASAPVAIASIPHLGWTTNILGRPPVRLVLGGVVVTLLLVGAMRLRRQMAESGDESIEGERSRSEVRGRHLGQPRF